MKEILLTLIVCGASQIGLASAQSPAASAPPSAMPAPVPAPALDPILAGEDIRGARGLVEIPRPPQWPFYAAAGAGTLALGGLLFWLWRQRRTNGAASAYDLAVAELEAARAWLRTESVERFSTVVSDVLRRYIARRFGITAPRKTTEEFLGILAEAKDSPLAVYRDPLRQFLSACDAAKFAKAMLTEDDMCLLWNKAREFLDATREVPGKSKSRRKTAKDTATATASAQPLNT